MIDIIALNKAHDERVQNLRALNRALAETLPHALNMANEAIGALNALLETYSKLDDIGKDMAADRGVYAMMPAHIESLENLFKYGSGVMSLIPVEDRLFTKHDGRAVRPVNDKVWVEFFTGEKSVSSLKEESMTDQCYKIHWPDVTAYRVVDKPEVEG